VVPGRSFRADGLSIAVFAPKRNAYDFRRDSQ
jgi:hypothetical protein